MGILFWWDLVIKSWNFWSYNYCFKIINPGHGYQFACDKMIRIRSGLVQMQTAYFSHILLITISLFRFIYSIFECSMCFISTTLIGSTVHFHNGVSIFIILAFSGFRLSSKPEEPKHTTYEVYTGYSLGHELSIQSVPITTYDGRSNLTYDEMHSIQVL